MLIQVRLCTLIFLCHGKAAFCKDSDALRRQAGFPEASGISVEDGLFLFSYFPLHVNIQRPFLSFPFLIRKLEGWVYLVLRLGGKEIDLSPCPQASILQCYLGHPAQVGYHSSASLGGGGFSFHGQTPAAAPGSEN